MRTGFGPLLIASVGLLTVVFSGTASPQFGVGYAAGKLVTSLAFGLPVFLLLKYATGPGRRLAAVESLNLLCVVVAAVWVVQLALPLVLPSVMPDRVAAEENPYSKFVQRPAPEAMRYRNPDGMTTPTTPEDCPPASGSRQCRHVCRPDTALQT